MPSYDETGGYCRICEKRVMVRRKGINHILHLLLAIVTWGGWSLVWLVLAIRIGGWRCPDCGGKASTRTPRQPKRARV
jgi:hypothetical protein